MSDATFYNNHVAQTIMDAERGVWDEQQWPVDHAVRLFMDCCLDLQVHAVVSVHGSRFMDKITLIRTLGGPDTRVTLRLRRDDKVEVRTVWGGRSAFCEIDAPALANVMCEAAGYMMELDSQEGGF